MLNFLVVLVVLGVLVVFGVVNRILGGLVVLGVVNRILGVLVVLGVVNRILGIFLVKAIVLIFLVKAIFLLYANLQWTCHILNMSHFGHVIFFRVAYVLPEMSIRLCSRKFQALDMSCF